MSSTGLFRHIWSDERPFSVGEIGSVFSLYHEGQHTENASLPPISDGLSSDAKAFLAPLDDAPKSQRSGPPPKGGGLDSCGQLYARCWFPLVSRFAGFNGKIQLYGAHLRASPQGCERPCYR